ncbi:putative ribonuclease H-like domain-containing protein [Tanacetum coccineum]|uniref:Ribonuclease H-like domain-containing protein n=1 Tax=Tanacetum coccineum TaxID=301880 RepID=A0ABQ4Z8H8_9ASTR
MVNLPNGKRAIGTKWVFRNKKDERGIVIRNKERLVAQGYTQEEGIDYDEVFAPVSRIEAIWLFFAHASYMRFIVYQMDVKSAFLYGTIEEERADMRPCLTTFIEMDLEVALDKTLFINEGIKFQVTPKTSHIHAEKRIFRYLKGQPKLGFRKSTIGGCCQFLGKRLISWQCKKQTIVANSTTEAEYVVAANCCGQMLWIQNQMLDYGFNFTNTKIYIDNESTICIVKSLVFHSKTKHIEIRHHFIRDSYEKKLIQMIKIHTDHNVADLLTKAFNSSGPINLVADGTVYKKWEGRMERAVTTASSLDAGNEIMFWATAKVKTVNGECQIQALVDKKKVIITEISIRSNLHLEDVDGTDCLPTAIIFEKLARMGYEKPSQKLTFYKAFFSP